MLTTGLLGPYRLSFDEIDRLIARPSPGVLALGQRDEDDAFRVNYIGRDDSDIRDRLRGFIGAEALFKYRLIQSQKAAFEKECELFHDFSPPCTRLHPDRPRGTNWTCPRCVAFALPR